MTITSQGYPGSLDRVGWAQTTEHATGGRYNIESNTHFNAAAGPGGVDRSIAIAAGGASGRGVYDESDATEILACNPVVSGTRWDMVVLNRNFLTKTTTLEIIEGGSTPAIPSRLTSVTAGVDQQPLWLAKVVAGQTTIQGWRDLRVWHGPGGCVAKDPLVLDYHLRPGTEITIGNEVYTRTIDPQTNVASWLKTTSLLQPLQLFAFGTSLAGGVPGAGAIFRAQAGSQVAVTDGGGFARVTFPTPFPNGLLSVLVCNGDSSVDRAAGTTYTMSVAGAPWDTGQKTDFEYAVLRSSGGHTPGVQHRVNWFAIGW
jgi:hypothetical protein